MIQFTIKDAVYKCPTSYYETTYRQVMALDTIDRTDRLKVYEVLTGIPYHELFTLKAIDVDVKIAPAMAFVMSPIDEGLTKKIKTINIGGKEYNIERDVDHFTLGQKIKLEERIIEASKNLDKTAAVIPFAVACYYYPIITGNTYSTEAAEKFMEEVIYDCPAMEVIAAGNFFLNKSLSYLSEIGSILITPPQKKSYLQRLTSWISSGYLRLSMHLRGVIY